MVDDANSSTKKHKSSVTVSLYVVSHELVLSSDGLRLNILPPLAAAPADYSFFLQICGRNVSVLLLFIHAFAFFLFLFGQQA